jgi:hypothetical protein
MLRIGLTAICLFLSCAVSPAQEVTCEQCRKLESEISRLETERQQLDKQVRERYQKKDYGAVNKINDQITEKVKETLDRQKKFAKDCRDACKPENVLKLDIKKIAEEIRTMEAGGTAEREIDEKYKELAGKSQQLDQMGEKDAKK